jgi:transposase-like protein
MKFKIHKRRRKRRNHPPSLIISLIEEVQKTGQVSATARKHDIGVRLLRKWRKKGITFFERKQ